MGGDRMGGCCKYFSQTHADGSGFVNLRHRRPIYYIIKTQSRQLMVLDRLTDK